MSTELMEIESEMATEMPLAQMEMLLGDDRPKIDFSREPFGEEPNQAARYNASRLWRDRADVAKAAVKMLAEPREVLPYRRIAKRLHISYHLLRQLEIQSASKIAEEKKTLGDLAYTATEAFLDRAISEATNPSSKMSGKDAMIGAGIGAEKFMLFRGEAGQRIEIGVKVDLTAKIEAARKEIVAEFENMKRATVTEVTEAPSTKHQAPGKLQIPNSNEIADPPSHEATARQWGLPA